MRTYDPKVKAHILDIIHQKKKAGLTFEQIAIILNEMGFKTSRNTIFTRGNLHTLVKSNPIKPGATKRQDSEIPLAKSKSDHDIFLVILNAKTITNEQKIGALRFLMGEN